MFEPEIESEPMTPAERWFSVGFLLLLLGLFAAEICVNYHPTKLSALFVVLFWVPLLALHESGHALMAALVGWRIRRVVIGMGRPMFLFRVGRAPVEIRLVPVEGFVESTPRNLRMPQLKSALIYLAGPGIELLVLALLCAALGPATLLGEAPNLWILAAQSLAVAILVSAFLNLVPHFVTTPQGRIANDGLGIIRSFFRTERDYARQMEGSEFDDPGDWQPYEPDDGWKWKR
jgi:hypothetical protein